MDELDGRLVALAERLAEDDPEPRIHLERRVRGFARRRRVQRAGLAGVVVLLAGGLALIVARQRDTSDDVRTSTVVSPARPAATVLTQASVVQLVGGSRARATSLSPTQPVPSSTVFKRTPFGIVGIVGPYGSGLGSSLVLIDASGSVARLAGPASGFALSPDLRRIAWLEPHIDADNYIRSSTLHEANFPELDGEVRTDINDQGSVVDYAGPVVLLNLGDGATGRGALWNPATGLVGDPQTIGLFASGTRDGRAVASPSDAGCNSLYEVAAGDAATPPSRGAQLQSLDCRGGDLSQDGTMSVSVGRAADLQPETIAIYRVSDGSLIATGPLPAAGPAYIVSWTDLDTFALVMHASTGGATWEVFVCDLHAACHSAGTVDAQPAYQGQVPLALVVDTVRQTTNENSATPPANPDNLVLEIPSGITPCRASELEFASGGGNPGELPLLRFFNRSGHPCGLAGYASVFGQDEKGQWQPVPTTKYPHAAVTAFPWTGVFDPIGAAVMKISADPDCNGTATPVHYTALRLVLPGDAGAIDISGIAFDSGRCPLLVTPITGDSQDG